MYFIWLIVFYFTLHVIFLVPLGAIILLLQYIVELTIGEIGILNILFFILLMGVLIAELWLTHLCARSMAYEKVTFTGALKSAFMEFKMYIQLALPFG